MFINTAKNPSSFFAEDFDAPVRRPVEMPLVVAEECFTGADMAAARQTAWDAGFQAGQTSVGAAAVSADAQILQAVTENIAQLRQEISTGGENIAEALAGLLLAALNQAMPAFWAHYGELEIQALAAEILPGLLHDPDVRVQIRPEREAGLRQFLMQRDPEMLDRMRLTPNAALGMSDIVIRWHQGEAIRDAMKIWEHIISILAPHGLWPITAAETICQENLSHVE